MEVSEFIVKFYIKDYEDSSIIRVTHKLLASIDPLRMKVNILKEKIINAADKIFVE